MLNLLLNQPSVRFNSVKPATKSTVNNPSFTATLLKDGFQSHYQSGQVVNRYLEPNTTETQLVVSKIQNQLLPKLVDYYMLSIKDFPGHPKAFTKLLGKYSDHFKGSSSGDVDKTIFTPLLKAVVCAFPVAERKPFLKILVSQLSHNINALEPDAKIKEQKLLALAQFGKALMEKPIATQSVLSKRILPELKQQPFLDGEGNHLVVPAQNPFIAALSNGTSKHRANSIDNSSLFKLLTLLPPLKGRELAFPGYLPENNMVYSEVFEKMITHYLAQSPVLLSERLTAIQPDLMQKVKTAKPNVWFNEWDLSLIYKGFRLLDNLPQLIQDARELERFHPEFMPKQNQK